MLSGEDTIYTTAMLMFAYLPVLSMRARRRQPSSHHLEPARVVAVTAFVLLLWLQVRKNYIAGIVMVVVNLALRALELVLYDKLIQVLWRRLTARAPAVDMMPKVLDPRARATFRRDLPLYTLYGAEAVRTREV